MIIFTITKTRPRAARRKPPYNPPELDTWKKTVKLHAMAAMRGKNPYNHTVRVGIRLVLKPKEKVVDGIEPCFEPPDVDNLAKPILDQLKGVCFTDDKYVSELNLSKVAGPEDECEITIEEIHVSEVPVPSTYAF